MTKEMAEETKEKAALKGLIGSHMTKLQMESEEKLIPIEEELKEKEELLHEVERKLQL